jgi:hypothetical protein
MAFLVMCAEKIWKPLCVFFVTFYAWIYGCLRLGPLLVALRSICQLKIGELPVAA